MKDSLDISVPGSRKATLSLPTACPFAITAETMAVPVVLPLSSRTLRNPGNGSRRPLDNAETGSELDLRAVGTCLPALSSTSALMVVELMESAAMACGLALSHTVKLSKRLPRSGQREHEENGNRGNDMSHA